MEATSAKKIYEEKLQDMAELNIGSIKSRAVLAFNAGQHGVKAIIFENLHVKHLL